MITNTRADIYEFIKRHGRARPVELVENFNITQAAVHRHVKKLVNEGKLQKVGKPPVVYYVLGNELERSVRGAVVGTEDFMNQNYLYVTPQGEQLAGIIGFKVWVQKLNTEKIFDQLLMEYEKNRIDANKFISIEGWIDSTKKISSVFEGNYVDGLFFKDFYSLPKFGRTRLGQLVMLAKGSGDKDLIGKIADECRDSVFKLMQKFKIDAVAFLPHSVPRKIQFLTEFEKKLKVQANIFDLDKAYVGIPIQQKSLSRLEDRIENANKTIFVKKRDNKFNNVLLIDDAVGSGATMNETAKKIKELGIAKKVFAFSIVGSIKGFEVISVV